MESAVTNNRTIFTIDDDAKVLKFLNIHLSSAGYKVKQSTGGNGVFSELDNNSYDLVICDMIMPDVAGVKILEYLRQKSDTIPIIMLTGVMDLPMAVEVMKKGAFDYLIKPILKENLLRTSNMAITQKEVIERNKELEELNRQHQNFLEQKVEERTAQLSSANEKLKKANDELRSLNMQFALVLGETVEAKDQMTFGHCSRMLYLCLKLGKFIGLAEPELESLEYATLLHDVGKVTVKEAVLNKPSSLTPEEYEHIKSHAFAGEKILGRIKPLRELAKMIGAHHEKYDGTGYPNGIKGDGIPVITRIISLMDTFDAMKSDRPYRKGLSLEVALEELKKVAGTQLVPEFVRVFIENKLYVIDEETDTVRSFMHIGDGERKRTG